MGPTILLFDVDGTLVHSRGAGKRALSRCFERRFGRRDVFDSLDFSGLTDPEILHAALAGLGVEPLPRILLSLFEEYVPILREELGPEGAVQPVPGARELLEVLSELPEAALGLGTGNIEAGARLKLGRIGFDTYFRFGGFGSDHLLRPELLRIGAARGRRFLGLAEDAGTVVVIGDTPRDIAAARALGARCIAVATGSHAPPALLEHHPDLLLRQLDPDAVLAFLRGG